MATKFSGLLLIPIVAILLVLRAVPRTPWTVMRREVISTPRKLVAAACVFASVIVVAVLVVWASYGFRYSATNDPSERLNIRLQSALVSRAKFQADHPDRRPTPQELAATNPGPITKLALFLNDRKLMPEAWLNGLLYTHHQSIFRASFLVGETRSTGWWYYFPLAMFFKTPLATLIVIVAAMAWAAWRWRRAKQPPRWEWICFGVPPIVYLLFAMGSNLNLGVRHVLPVYPFLFILAGAAFAALWEWRRRMARMGGAVLLVLLAAETLAAYPNYIAFFGVTRGPYRGIGLLGDSNLDWGQDLPLLAKWQREHPSRPIYLKYFGSVDPAGYVDAKPLELNNWPAPPAVVAVSATYLQGLHLSGDWNDFLAPLRRQEPIAILGGGTIYLFESPVNRASSTAPTANGTSTTP
jgi:hypothetical protein